MCYRRASQSGSKERLRRLQPRAHNRLARSQQQRAGNFLTIEREEIKPAPVAERIKSFEEFISTMQDAHAARQAARCMDCGTPYCHTGCPVNNEIPDWNEMVVCGQWKAAARNLHLTNNVPEITGRLCPAPCEEACTLYLHDAPVAIKSIERAIADRLSLASVGNVPD